ncbi:MAG: hypothetical protein ACRETR_07675 [Steroidobacteraceae bacterium]
MRAGVWPFGPRGHPRGCRHERADRGTNQANGPTRWPAGSSVVLVFEPQSGSRVGFEFHSNRLPATTVFMDHLNPGRNADPPLIMCGVMPYYYFSVAYDASRGVIGLKVR